MQTTHRFARPSGVTLHFVTAGEGDGFLTAGL